MNDDYKDEIEKLYANYNRDLLKQTEQTFTSTISDEVKEKLYNRMPQCTGDVNYKGSNDYKEWHRCIGSHTFEDHNEIPELNGFYKKYTGLWEKGNPHGKGIYETPFGYKGKNYNIERYEGEFNYYERYYGDIHNYFERYDDLRNYFEYHGKGKWFRDGNKYDGEWKNGLKHGKGIYNWANGDQYEGDWRYNHFEGIGTFIWSNGSRYDGEWYEGEKHGLGTLTQTDGSIEKGLWKNNKKIK